MNRNLDKSAIAQRIREARVAAGYTTQISFANAAKVSAVTANQWETGKRLPKTEELVRVSTVVGRTIDELLHGAKGDPAVHIDDLVAFFETPEGRRLSGEQRYGLARFVSTLDKVDQWKLRAVVELLFGADGKGGAK